MDIQIREYRLEDRSALEALIQELQDHVAVLDRYRLILQGTDFQRTAYVDRLLQKVQERSGVILVAEQDGRVVGCIVGTIPEPDGDYLLDHALTREGFIHELIVSQAARASGIGSKLMRAIDTFFLEHGCTFARVECFAPNAGSLQFYHKMGYEDRLIELMKKL